MKIYIIESNSLLNPNKRCDHIIVGYKNALEEYEDCFSNGERPILFSTIVNKFGRIEKANKIK